MPVFELLHKADDKMVACRQENSCFSLGFPGDDHRHAFGIQIVSIDWHKKCMQRLVPFFDVRSFTCAFLSDL